MLKTLRISNIVLVENEEIHFSKGFNVLTGETGSGKSAIINALNYIAGERADSAVLRHGAEKGVIEASFDIENTAETAALLQEGGIDHEQGDELIVKRELFCSGKSRAFVNNQMASVSFLKSIGKHLLEIVGQHANLHLTNLQHHREILDRFGGLEKVLEEFQEKWKEECKLKEALALLKDSEAKRIREMETLQREIKELSEANLKEGEEEELFSAYCRLSNSEELSKRSEEIYLILTKESDSVIPNLKKIQKDLQDLVEKDPSLKEVQEVFNSAAIEIEEIAYAVKNYQLRIEYNPRKTEEISERLTLINKLKKKYGAEEKLVLSYQKEAEERLNQLEERDLEIEELQNKIFCAEKDTEKSASLLTEKRKAVAQKLEEEMKKQLVELNMPKANFSILFLQHPRSLVGDEAIEFIMAPNTGEKNISIRECASGGELSRILLALKTLLARSQQSPVIVFDEIDANIGGETATVIGKKLREIGSKHQVLCITHFPQVANFAAHHIQISKLERNGRTYTEIATLDQQGKSKELARMSGAVLVCKK